MEINKSDIFKQREFSELISDIINFYISEAKYLLKFVFSRVLLLIILKSILLHYYTMYFYSEYFEISNFYQLLRYGPIEQIAYSLVLKIFDMLIYTKVIVISLAYFKTYAKNGSVDTKDIKNETKSYYFKVLKANIIIAIFLIPIILAFEIPFVYLFLIFSVIPVFIIIEDLKFGEAVKKSFRILKKNWLKSFGAFLVIALIYLIVTLIISLIFSRFALYFTYMRIFFVLVSIIIGVLYSLIAVLPAVLSGFLYASFIGDNDTQQKTSVIFKRDKSKKEDKKTRYTNDNLPDLHDKDKQKNRFLNDNETDRFKPKY